MKTQYTIENVDIPMLMRSPETLTSRATRSCTHGRTARASNVPYNQLGWEYPYRVIWSGLDAT